MGMEYCRVVDGRFGGEAAGLCVNRFRELNGSAEMAICGVAATWGRVLIGGCRTATSLIIPGKKCEWGTGGAWGGGGTSAESADF